ncbi:long-chain-alcohol oxidase FAO4A-like protein, partial [Trifolium pratense]
MEFLSQHIIKNIDDGLWKLVRLSRNGHPLSRLFFTDDVLLFAKETKSQALNIDSMLKQFAKYFGLKVNATNPRFSSTRRGKISSIVASTACGALSTPPLLERSGLKNKNIGRNLHLYPVTMASGYFPIAPELWPEEHKKSYEGGIMTAMSTVATDFNKSGYGAVIQTPSSHPGLFSILMPWNSGTDIKDRMHKFSRTAHVFALARDQASGTVVDSPN